MEKHPQRRRLDVLMVERGLADSREKARAFIMAGEVKLKGQTLNKPGTLVLEEAELELASPPPFVGRGGIKLAHALDSFELDPSGRVALDVGASTGGFTDCLLKRGAKRVYALDVGYGQLDYRLRQDPRVVVKERVNARYPFELPEIVDIATIDVSFISVEKVIPQMARWVRSDGRILILFKPQFQVEKGQVGKKGVVRNPLFKAAALGRFFRWAADNGFRLKGFTTSPILGDEGNQEFFVLLKKDLEWHEPLSKD